MAVSDGVGWPPSWMRQLAMAMVRCACGKEWKPPKHVAFVMDGNRRHADAKRVKKAEGHRAGFQALLRALGWSFEIGVRHVSAFAFAIDNFRRDPDEVSALMDLAEDKLEAIAENDTLAKHDVRVRVVGDWNRLPEKVRVAAKKAMEATEARKGACLDVFLAYAARDELATAVETMRRDLARGRLESEQVVEEELLKRTMNYGAPPVDLLVRTSGERRLSDFLLAQSAHAHLVFLDVLWPELSYWDLARAVLEHGMANSRKLEKSTGEMKSCIDEQFSSRNRTDNDHALVRAHATKTPKGGMSDTGSKQGEAQLASDEPWLQPVLSSPSHVQGLSL
eukprot:CAMPEP_0183827606 /NCGR_PEP_ID=MMETSP0807_2-20130328/2337_1 /TAXON_ID=88271 /ORGANISM="Picocystis salinarum, Strain CCMP1897" /LENGTH=335 /DNA_ID=CAMNT_0026072773 /DNA_START=8 /DNA_END=1016 /DNA_ORIENTATION=+